MNRLPPDDRSPYLPGEAALLSAIRIEETHAGRRPIIVLLLAPASVAALSQGRAVIRIGKDEVFYVVAGKGLDALGKACAACEHEIERLRDEGGRN